ncbi:MAG: ABC transporter permease [Ilumatobacteraceae bacterium]
MRSAFRSLRRKRLFSALNIAGLAIGITIFFLGLEYYRFEQGFNAFHPNGAQLYRVVIETPEGKTAASFPALAPLMERLIPGVRRAIRFGDSFNDGAIVAYQPPGSQPLRSFRENGCVFVDASFLDAFHFPLLAGTNRLDEMRTVVITAAAADRLFGHEQAIGKIIRLHNQFGDLSLTVTGVAANVPDQSDIRFDYLLPAKTLEDPRYTEGSDWAALTTWDNDGYTTYCWLDSAADQSAVAAQATQIWKENDPLYARKKGHVSLQPLREIHLGQGLKDNNPTWASYGLTVIVFSLSILVLLIAWVNYINFTTADSLTRSREIGIHKVTGSSRWHIIARAVAEGVLLNLSALIAALFLAQMVQGLLNYIAQKPLSLHYLADWDSWLIIFLVLGTGTLAGGAYTGGLLSRLQPVTAIRFSTPQNTGHGLMRKGLVAFQLTISCVFIAVTLVGFKQIRFMKKHDLGMQIDRLVVIEGPALRDSAFRSRSAGFKNDIRALPFVASFCTSGSAPGMGSGHNYSSDGITGMASHPGDDRTEYSISEVDEHYFSTYGIPVLYGNDFSLEDANLGYKGDRLIVNEKAARLLGYDPADCIGHAVHWNKNYTIAGVVRDYHHSSLKTPIEPILFVPQHNNSCYTIQTDGTALAGKMDIVKRIYEKYYPGNSFTWLPVRETFDRHYENEDRTGIIALSLAVLVIAISALGLVGLAAFSARRRMKEMGIRKVLGASVLSLFSLLSAEYLFLVALAFVIATPISWSISHQWLLGFAYRTKPDWSIWLITGLSCLGITLLTVSYHAFRTAFVNVVRQLKTE